MRAWGAWLRVALLFGAVVAIGCEVERRTEELSDWQPVAIADQEDAVCGMLVREQSAPRAQVVHRDGERFFFCSLGDLLVYLSAPSPHGRVETSFVEVLNVDEDPLATHTAAHEWRRASEAFYVIGVERRGIMGDPVLAYASSELADHAARRYLGRIVAFDELAEWWRSRVD